MDALVDEFMQGSSFVLREVSYTEIKDFVESLVDTIRDDYNKLLRDGKKYKLKTTDLSNKLKLLKHFGLNKVEDDDKEIIHVLRDIANTYSSQLKTMREHLKYFEETEDNTVKINDFYTKRISDQEASILALEKDIANIQNTLNSSKVNRQNLLDSIRKLSQRLEKNTKHRGYHARMKVRKDAEQAMNEAYGFTTRDHESLVIATRIADKKENLRKALNNIQNF